MRLRALTSAAAIAAALVVFPATAQASSVPAPILWDGPNCGTIQYGQINGCVTSLQMELNKFDFGLSVDGDFGGHTLDAVKWVQTKAHLQDPSVAVDGNVGPVTKTWIRTFENLSYLPLGVVVYTGSAECTVQLDPHPNAGTASGVISWDGGTCSGAMYLSNDGGRSRVQSSGYHSITSGYVPFYPYTDTASQLEEVCVTATDATHSSGEVCTPWF
ncbi:MAG: peptidoglycan-binding protein [Catenulispora sp.]|nr:peptidoglycan-binding protein [Catenulispora sp.]